jgi:ATP synthase protein I
MSDNRDNEVETISRKSRQMEQARKRKRRSAWFGLGMFGMIGWAVAIPVLAGIALGLWIDSRWPGGISWTLVLLFAGVALGCLNAWYWLQREGRDD